MSEQTTETTETELTLDDFLGEKTSFTPYEVAGIVNDLLEAAGSDKTIPPQMAYQYVTKGYIKGTRSERTTKGGKVVQAWSVSREDAEAWITKYVKKQLG